MAATTSCRMGSADAAPPSPAGSSLLGASGAKRCNSPAAVLITHTNSAKNKKTMPMPISMSFIPENISSLVVGSI